MSETKKKKVTKPVPAGVSARVKTLAVEIARLTAQRDGLIVGAALVAGAPEDASIDIDADKSEVSWEE